jgi:hypothetical protein
MAATESMGAARSRRPRRRRGKAPPAPGLSEQDRATIRAAVAALDPLTDEQIAAVCEVITTSRIRWRREAHRSGGEDVEAA